MKAMGQSKGVPNCGANEQPLSYIQICLLGVTCVPAPGGEEKGRRGGEEKRRRGGEERRRGAEEERKRKGAEEQKRRGEEQGLVGRIEALAALLKGLVIHV